MKYLQRPRWNGIVFSCFLSGIGALSGNLYAAETAPEISPDATVIDFDNEIAGNIPNRFTQALTGRGGKARWEVEVADDEAVHGSVVTQLSDNRTSARYPVLVHDEFITKNLDISVDFKTISGKRDASAGIVFRYLDKKNYYVVRANSLEGNVVAYKTVNGKRSNIGVLGKRKAYGVETPVLHQAWQNLRVIANDTIFEIYLNDKLVFEVENDVLTKPGKVGLWTKSDAVTQFDNLIIQSLD